MSKNLNMSATQTSPSLTTSQTSSLPFTTVQTTCPLSIIQATSTPPSTHSFTVVDQSRNDESIETNQDTSYTMPDESAFVTIPVYSGETLEVAPESGETEDTEQSVIVVLPSANI